MDGASLHTVTPYGRGGGSSRVRVFDWLDHLGLAAVTHDYVGLSTNSPARLGRHPVAVARAEVDLRRLARSVSSSTVLLSKQASPFSTGAIEERLLGAARLGVYDVDDSLLDEVSGGRAQALFPKSRIWRRAVRAADVVIAGNDYLADQAAAAAPAARVLVIPSCVQPDDYRVKRDYVVSASPRAVWLGTPSTEAHLSTIAEPLLRVHRSHGLRLTLISAGAADLGPLAAMTDRLDWTPAASDRLADADVGLMPLPDTPYTRGKCAYKLLQYAASGLPSVASPVGANADAVARGLASAASAPDEWAAALVGLIEASEGRRAEAGARARAAVCAYYSLDAWAETWQRGVGLRGDR